MGRAPGVPSGELHGLTRQAWKPHWSLMMFSWLHPAYAAPHVSLLPKLPIWHILTLPITETPVPRPITPNHSQPRIR